MKSNSDAHIRVKFNIQGTLLYIEVLVIFKVLQLSITCEVELSMTDNTL